MRMPFSATRDLWLVLKARDEGTRALRSFSTNIRDVARQVQIAEALSNKADAQRFLRQQKMSGATKAEMDATRNLIDGYDKQARALKTLDMKQEEHRRKTLMLSQSLQGLGSVAATAGLILTGVGVAGAVAMAKLVTASIEYNRTVALTKTQIDGFQASLQDLSKEGLDVANNIGVPFEDIQKTLYDIFSSTNANLSQSKILLDAFAKTAVAGQVSLQDASRGTMAIMNAFHIPLERVNNVLDVEFQLVRKGVGTYEEFSKIIGRVAPSANRAGQSLETMSAMLAFLTRNGLSAAMAAASSGRALDAFSNPAAVKNLEGMGIQMKNAKGEFRDLSDILTQLSVKFKGLTGPERSKAISDLFKGAGGTIQARRFIDQVLKPGEVDRFKGFLKDMQNATGQFGNAYQTMAATAANKTQLLSNKWNVLKVTAGNILTPVFLVLVSALNSLLTSFNNLSPGTQKIIVLALAATTAFSILGGITLFVISGIASLAAAVVVAGSAVFVTTGIIAGLIGAFAGLAAAIAISWKYSEGFRETIREIIVDFQLLYTNAILPVGRGLRDAWIKYMNPALQQLRTVMEQYIIPTFTDLRIRIVEQLIPAFREAGMMVKSAVSEAFKFFGMVIRNILIPAIKFLVKEYDDHQAQLAKIMPILKQVVKWFLIGAAVIVTIFIVALAGIGLATVAVIAAFAAIVISIFAVIDGVKWLVHWFEVEIPKAWNATKNFAIRIWNDIANFFIGIWNSITSFFSGVWSSIVGVFNSAMSTISALWQQFWEGSIGRLLKAIWNFIVATVQLGIALLMLAVEIPLKALQLLWEATWSLIGGTVKTVWKTILLILVVVWTTIWNNAVSIWGKVSGFFSRLWAFIHDGVMFYWNKITSWLEGKWHSAADKGTSIWTGLKNGIESIFGGIYKVVKDKIDMVLGFFKNAGAWLFDAGKHIVQGLIDGITSMIDKVTEKIKELTKKIKDHLPFSPAKTGPLSGRGNPFYSGQAISKLLASGMESKMTLITSASNKIANAATLQGSANYIGSTQTSGGREVNQTFNIHTQEINPRRHSAELGFALAARI